jgi:predicted DNA-binding mobile mystery protein A
MRAEDLATLMGVSQPSLTRLEKSERTGSIRLDTLTRAADALECDVVYALVPRRSLEDIVQDQARRRALARVGKVAHTMALEDQALDDSKLDARVKMMADFYLNSPGLWSGESEISDPTTSAPSQL